MTMNAQESSATAEAVELLSRLLEKAETDGSVNSVPVVLMNQNVNAEDVQDILVIDPTSRYNRNGTHRDLIVSGDYCIGSAIIKAAIEEGFQITTMVIVNEDRSHRFKVVLVKLKK